MDKEKNIPFKNYIILSVVLILTIIGVIYFYMWYTEFETNKINTPILDDYLSVINYNELQDYLIENKNVILYVSMLDDDTRSFEKKFRGIIDKYELNNSILYMDLTNEKNNSSIYYDFINKYNIGNLPYLLIFENGKVSDRYSIQDNNYDLELLVSYLRIEGVIND